MIPRLRRQAGQALPMVIGMMMFFSITVTTVIVYSSSQERASDRQKKTEYAEAAAEAALSTATSVLGGSPDPTISTILPSCATPTALSTPPPGTGADYCGALNGLDWTITARGWISAATSAATGQVRIRTITQVGTIKPFFAGGLGEGWNRLYADDTTHGCTTFNKDVITVPVVVRGCAQLNGDDHHPTELLGPVSIGTTLTLHHTDSIGLPGSPAPEADIGGTCNLEHGSGAHSPCSAADAVYASAVTTTPSTVPRPTADFSYWYSHATLGPMSGCTSGALPGTSKFDKNTTYNRDNPAFQLTPSGISYSCQVWSSPPNGGTELGELSWDAVNQILTVNGTIFFDGDLKATAPGHSKACAHANHGPYCDTSFSYVGRGTIYTSGKVDIEAGLCAGGDGSNDCETDPSNWDPTQNLLIFMAGGLRHVDEDAFTMNQDQAVYQGAVWAQGRCKIDKKASISAPLLCGQLNIKEDDTVDDPSVNPWPDSLVAPSNGQLYPSPPGDFQVMFGPEYQS